MYPVLFEFGKLSIYSWGFMLAIAVLVSIYGVGKLFEREGLDQEKVIDMILLMIVAGVIGAKLAYILVYEWTILWTDPLSLFSISQGGIAGLIWYGGLVGGAVPFLIYLRKNEWSFWQVTDILAPFIALGYAIVRIGCFLNGCCYGDVTDSACSVVFPYVDAFARYPTQIFSSILNFFLFGFLIWWYPRRKFVGQVFIYYILGYSLYRFIIEFFRESIIMVGPFTLGQIYTLILLAFGIFLYFWRRSTLRRE